MRQADKRLAHTKKRQVFFETSAFHVISIYWHKEMKFSVQNFT
jgi:hypothetical protein